MLDPVASHIPWMVAAGNHEIEDNLVEGGVFAAYEHRFRMPAAGSTVRGTECSRGGGLDGNETACGRGLDDFVALRSAADAEGVVEAVLHAREAITPFGGPVETTGWPETRENSGGRQREGIEHHYSCGASQWSGTYNFGNRWVVLCMYVW